MWTIVACLSLASVPLAAAPPLVSPSDNRLFANPPLLYEGNSSSDGYWPYATPTPGTSSPRTRLDAVPVASRNTEIPSRLPQDDYRDGFPPLTAEIADDEFLVGGPKLTAFKDGFFQKLSFSETYLPRWSAEGLGINEVETFVTVAVPMPKREWPMLITPYFQWRALDGPTVPEAPANLYETYVDFMWIPRVSPRWTGIVAVAPAMYSDFESSSQNRFRLTGKGLVRYDAVPEQLQVIAGVLFLNREDIRLLPAGGLIWDPNRDMHYEIVFPRPKLMHRFNYGNDWENWLYLAAEFGGNSFAITRTDGTADTLILYDNRITLGFEHKRNGGAGMKLEIGVVFNRRVELVNPSIETHPGATGLVRGVITF